MINVRTIAKVAELFYIYGFSQYEIAKKFNFSAAKISRIIKEAKRRKLINFTIINFDKRILTLERDLENYGGLKEAIIYYNSDFENYDDDIIFQELGNLGAEYLERVIKDGLNIALTWGMTLNRFIDKINYDKEYRLNIFSTLGGVQLKIPEVESNYLIQMMSTKIGGTPYPIYIPLLLEKNEYKTILSQKSDIKKILGSGSEIDYYFSSVGTINEKSRVCTLDGFDIDFIEELKSKGIVGEIGLHFFDRNGNFIKSGIEDRIINLSIEELRKIKNKIIIVFGKEKIEALKGFLKTGLCDVIITDSKTTELLLEK